MNIQLVAIATLLLSLAAPAFPHRLDEYLQATIFSLEKNHVQAFMRLVPGVAVSSVVLASIDVNRDGVISVAEQQAYADRVLHDLSLKMDGHLLKLRLVSVTFPKTEEMKEGLGEIQIEFRADWPSGDSKRELVFENHHQSGISVYLVNSLVPQDPKIRIITQKRNGNQSFYQLDYAQAGNPSGFPFHSHWSTGGRFGTAVLLSAGIVLLSQRRQQTDNSELKEPRL